jgi:hypothetical protein
MKVNVVIKREAGMLSNLYNAVFYFLWGIGYFIRATFVIGWETK